MWVQILYKKILACILARELFGLFWKDKYVAKLSVKRSSLIIPSASHDHANQRVLFYFSSTRSRIDYSTTQLHWRWIYKIWSQHWHNNRIHILVQFSPIFLLDKINGCVWIKGKAGKEKARGWKEGEKGKERILQDWIGYSA